MNRIPPNSPQPAAQQSIANPQEELAATPDRHAPVFFSEREDFLDKELCRPDLLKLCQSLDEHLGPYNWAFTGSTALLIHARSIEAPGLVFNRTPADADVLVKETALSRFDQEDLKGSGLQFKDGKRHILELKHADNQPPLKIDLIKSGKGSFGSIEKNDPVLIHKVPVLSLKGLQQSLTSRLRANEATGNSQGDLALVNQLLAHQQAGPLSSIGKRSQLSPDQISAPPRARRRFGVDADSGSPRVLGGHQPFRGLNFDSP